VGLPTPPPVLTPNLDTNIGLWREVKMDVNSIADQFKKGYKTSEFWLSLLTKVAVIVGVLGFDLDTAEIGTLIAVTLGSDTYGGVRTWLKRKRLDTVSPYEEV
jgi:hypothetical protein